MQISYFKKSQSFLNRTLRVTICQAVLPVISAFWTTTLGIGIAIIGSSVALPAFGLELANPPVTMCIRKPGEGAEVVEKLTNLETVLFNWKNAQGSVVILLNQLNSKDISVEEFKSKMNIVLPRLAALTDLLVEETKVYRQSFGSRDESSVQMTDSLFEQMEAGLQYLRVSFGNEEVSFETAQAEYDRAWVKFTQTWNIHFGLVGCTSTNPWVRF